jgi:hypothetical protein
MVGKDTPLDFAFGVPEARADCREELLTLAFVQLELKAGAHAGTADCTLGHGRVLSREAQLK